VVYFEVPQPPTVANDREPRSSAEHPVYGSESDGNNRRGTIGRTPRLREKTSRDVGSGIAASSTSSDATAGRPTCHTSPSQ